MNKNPQNNPKIENQEPGSNISEQYLGEKQQIIFLNYILKSVGKEEITNVIPICSLL